MMISHGFALCLALLLSFTLLGIQLAWSLIQWHQMQKTVYRMLRKDQA